MSLAIGTVLGRYKIIGVLGKGGMGEVYRGHDPQLNREVAIKTSAQHFTERFEREARAIAALNHPNICQIYDVGPSYLVMELVEGASPKGPMEVDEALRIAGQIAAALQEAHAKQITHRDLKPGNIIITPQGVVKVLDFGLAKMSGGSVSVEGEHTPTLTIGATVAGAILGTPAYMSPEQARGKTVDARADIWSFGVVLYELIVGQRPFHGEDLTEMVASVVKERPNLEAVPRRVRRLLEACLEKDPAKRLQSIGDMKYLLDEESAAAAAAAPVAKPSKLPWALTAVGIVLAGVALWAPWKTVPAPPDLVLFQIDAPPKATFTNWMTLSPDGKKVAFTARDEDGQVHLWIRPVDSLEARPITITSTNPVPFWSADSRWIAYQLDGNLRKVEAAGGPSQALGSAPNAFGGGVFSPDGATILFGSSSEGLKQISSNGGVAREVTKLDSARQETGHFMPAFLPDGKHFIYQRQASNQDNSGTFLGSVDDKPGAPVGARLIAGSLNAIYASAGPHFGYILFRRERALMAQGFDEAKLALVGEPVLVADPVGAMSGKFLNVGVSAKTLIFRDTGLADLRQLKWVDRSGKASEPLTEPGNWTDLRLNAAGTQAVAHHTDDQGNTDVYTIDLARHLPTRLTFDRGVDVFALWSPDGSKIAFTSDRDGTRNLYRKPANGSAPEVLLYKSAERKQATDWSRDGKLLMFTSQSNKTKNDIWILTMDGTEHKATLLLGSEANEGNARFSPDGRFVAYQSDESGTSEVYMRTFPEGGGKWQISKGGGGNPRWSGDGRQIYYSTNSALIAAVKVQTSPVVQVADPEKVPVVWDGGPYEVSPDGRFLVALADGTNSVNPITVILNWQEMLKK